MTTDPRTLADRVAAERELLMFAMTPPRVTTPPDKAQALADATLQRIDGLDVDALVLYDLDDESDRVDAERPFPFLETMDPQRFLSEHLRELDVPAVVYRCVGKYEETELQHFLADHAPENGCVFVGASSSDKPVATTLRRAMELRQELRPDVPLGAVAIPERHARSGTEHERLLRKQEGGCSMFITQIIYDVSEAKDLVSDYAYACERAGIQPARMVFTLSLCGSEKTLEFLRWLGVDVPRWVENELRAQGDTLETSYEHCLAAARELARYCRYLGIPFGFNVESVSTRRVEIEATVELAREIGQILHRGPDDAAAVPYDEAQPTSAFPGRRATAVSPR